MEDYSKETIKSTGFEGGKVTHSFDTNPKQPDVATSEIIFDVKGFINAGSLGAFTVSPIFSSSSIYSMIKRLKSSELPPSIGIYL